MAREDKAFAQVFCDAALDTILAVRPEAIRQGQHLLSPEVRGRAAAFAVACMSASCKAWSLSSEARGAGRERCSGF